MEIEKESPDTERLLRLFPTLFEDCVGFSSGSLDRMSLDAPSGKWINSVVCRPQQLKGQFFCRHVFRSTSLCIPRTRYRYLRCEIDTRCVNEKCGYSINFTVPYLSSFFFFCIIASVTSDSYASRSGAFNAKRSKPRAGTRPHFLRPLLNGKHRIFPVNTEHPSAKLHASLRDYQYASVIALHSHITRRSVLRKHARIIFRRSEN
jgi:hypothetical protein